MTSSLGECRACEKCLHDLSAFSCHTSALITGGPPWGPRFFHTAGCEPCPNSFSSVPSLPTPHTGWELEDVPHALAQAKEERLLLHLAAALNTFPITEGWEKRPVYAPGWIPSSSSSPKGNERVWNNSTPAPAACRKRRSQLRVAEPKVFTSVFGRKHSQGPQNKNILKSYMGPVFCTWNRLWHHSGLYPKTLFWGAEGSFIPVVVSSSPQSRQLIQAHWCILCDVGTWKTGLNSFSLFFFFPLPRNHKRYISESQPTWKTTPHFWTNSPCPKTSHFKTLFSNHY